MRRSFCAVGVAVAMCLASVVTTVAVAGKRTPDIPVKVTFRNATLPPDRMLSVGSPTYVNGEPGVLATISGSSGRLLLNTCFNSKGGKTCASQGRYEAFDYNQPANALLPLPFPTPTAAPATLQVWTFEQDGVTFLARGFLDVMNVPGETRLGGMNVNFPVNGAGYTLRFTPNMYPTSNYLLVTYLGGSTSCTTANPSACASWSVEAGSGSFAPYPNSSCCWTTSLQDIGELVTMDNSADYGQYHMPFKITVSVLPK